MRVGRAALVLTVLVVLVPAALAGLAALVLLGPAGPVPAAFAGPVPAAFSVPVPSAHGWGGGGSPISASSSSRADDARTRAVRRLHLAATASTLRPTNDRAVTVTARVRDGAGRPLKGVRVRVPWVLPDRTVGTVKTTGRTGRVRFARFLRSAAAGDVVTVKVRAGWRGQVRRRLLRLTVTGGPTVGPRLAPQDLVYAGAFRLPGPSGDSSWGWSGDGLTYYPDGDPGGEADGYAGSLFGIGHDWQHFVSEVSIPAPVISAGKDPQDLPRARTLQPFADVRGDLYPALGDEILRADIEYLPAQGAQAQGKLYLCWGRHMQLGEANATHMWCDLDLSRPRPAGPWSVGGYDDYVTCDYLFGIDPAWAAANTPGKLLATGRFRDGGQGAMGPSIFAIAPWNSGDPPAPEATLPAVPLLLYDNVWNGGADILDGYHHSDEWSGAAWITAGDRGAVVFAGTKGRGACWYGFADGTVWPDGPPYPSPLPDGERGWWSTGFDGELLFYDPADLAAVAAGTLPPDQPQPYAVLLIDEYLFAVRSAQQKRHVAAVTFDRRHGRLFVVEPLADGDDSIVHVWTVR